MLRLENFSCGYGQMTAIQNLDLQAGKGSITALLGANGAGKTSLLMSVAGQVALKRGRIFYQDRDISSWSPMKRVRAGIGLVPEGRRLFSSLSVRENLIVGGYIRPASETGEHIQEVLRIFPRLGERMDQKGGSLSGGEQQMLAIGRALMSRPGLLLVDELSLGLMPKAIDLCYQALLELNKQQMSIVLVEQSTQRALEVADQVLILESGRIVWQGTREAARQNTDLIDSFLGLK